VIRFPGNGADVWILKSHISRVECERSAFGRTEPLVIDQQGANGLRTALPVLLHIPSYDTLGVSFRTSTTPRTHQTGEPSYSLLDELPRDRRFNAKMGMCSLRLNLTLTSRSIPPQLFPTIPKLDGRNVPRAATPASSWNPLTVSQSWSILDSLSFDIPSPLFLSNTETSLPSLTACEL